MWPSWVFGSSQFPIGRDRPIKKGHPKGQINTSGKPQTTVFVIQERATGRRHLREGMCDGPIET